MKKAILTALTLCFGVVLAADQFAPQRAEFAKYYKQITGKDAPDGIVKFAIDPKVSKRGRDAYRIVSGNAAVAGRPPYRAGGHGRAGSPLPAETVVITGSNTRSVWYGLYDLLERRGGCHWFWDGDVVPKRDAIDLSNLDVHEEAHFEYRAIRYFAHRGLSRFQAEHWGPDDWKKEPTPIPRSPSPAPASPTTTARSSGASSTGANCATTSRSTPLRAG